MPTSLDPPQAVLPKTRPRTGGNEARISTAVPVPGKKTPGEPGHTRAHGSHRRASQLSQPTNAPKRPRDDRISGRLNGRSPGADRSPRPTRRPPPAANPTQPPPAPPGGAGHTHAPDHTQTPRCTHCHQPSHTSHTQSSSVVLTVMATVPRQESSEDRPHPGSGAQEGASVRRSRAMLT
jgi:hypothetical protein